VEFSKGKGKYILWTFDSIPMTCIVDAATYDRDKPYSLTGYVDKSVFETCDWRKAK
jgi:hypothetical protein